jgi:NADH-quinone oxidoreductase subunit F
MLEVLEKISEGRGERKDIDLLLEMGEVIKDSSFCGLGQSAPNPVLSTIRYFKDEYLDHIENKHCDSSVCASLFTSPCQNACPANVDVPLYIDAIRQGDYKRAYQIIQTENPLVLVCGRVCYNLCENACNRDGIDESLAIRELKRFASDYLLKNEDGFPIPEIEAEKDKKIAVIGSGPSGLTAAFYLRKKGYQVTIFEAETEVGGMLALGIPEYRLPKDLLNEEIGVLTAMGVEIVVNTKIGEDILIEDLREEGFWAVYMAVGAQKDRKLNIEGSKDVDGDGYFSALNFLKQLNQGHKFNFEDKKVSVIGGGNAAIDTARNIVRLGAEEVNIIYRRSKNDMPAHKEEIKEAEYERVNIYSQLNPHKIHSKNGRITQLECLKVKGGKFDKSGRRKPVEIQNSKLMINTDIVISAVGQEVEDYFNKGKFKVELTQSNLIKTEGDFSTNFDWIFAGGDCVNGPSTVVESIQQGKKAASEIDKYLGGDGIVVKKEDSERNISSLILEEQKSRVKMPTILLSERKRGFKEVEKGYSLDQAVEEASRCLRCDVKEKEEVI